MLIRATARAALVSIATLIVSAIPTQAEGWEATAAETALAGDLLVSSSLSGGIQRYNGRTGSARGEFVPGNGGLSDATDLVFGPDGNAYVVSRTNDRILRFDGTTGAFIDVFIGPEHGASRVPGSVLFGPDGNIYVGYLIDRSVLRFDGKTGAFIDEFVAPGSGGLLSPSYLVFGPDDHLYISGGSAHNVLRYDGTTGAFLGEFIAPGVGGLSFPAGLAFGPNGDLCIASSNPPGILRFDGTTGAFIDTFVPFGSGGFLGSVHVLFGPDGNLYLDSMGAESSSILRYNGLSGAFIDVFIPSLQNGQADPAHGVRFGPNGDFYVSTFNLSADKVLQYDGGTGAFVRDFVAGGGSGGLANPRGLTIGPDGNLYVSSTAESEILRYNGRTGAFLDTFVAAGSGGLSIPKGLAFGPDGQLYVGSANTSSVLRYNGETGAFIDAFVSSGSGGLLNPQDMVFRPDGRLYVVDAGSHSVLRYDGLTGAFIDEFVTSGSGGLVTPIGLAFDATGRLLVGSSGTNDILRYDQNGAFMDVFVTPGSGGLDAPVGLVFGADSDLYVCSFFNNQILLYDGQTGSFIDAFVPSGSGGLTGPSRLLFIPSGDCNDNGIDDKCDVSCAPLQCDSKTCGTSRDCNGNGIPDECDLADGTLVDEDGDGIPDGCEDWIGGVDIFWGNLFNWNPPVVPDGPGFFANIVGQDQVVVLNIDATIDALNLIDGPTLNISLGDLIVATTAGILNGGTIVVENDHLLDSVGDFVMERNGVPLAGAAGASALAAEPKLVVRGSTVVIRESLESLEGGDVLVASLARITVTEAMTLAGGATYQEIPDFVGGTAATITAGSILLSSNARGDGTMILQDEMKVVVGDGTAARGTAAVAGGTIKLACGSAGGGIARGGCTPPRLGLAMDGDATLDAGAMIVSARTVDVAGPTLDSGQPNIDLDGQLTLEGLGSYQADPERVQATGAWLAAGSVLISTDDQGEGGFMSLDDTMLVQTFGSFTLNIATTCAGLLRGGCTPPRLSMRGGSNLQVGGALVIGDGTEVIIGDGGGLRNGGPDSQAAGLSVRLSGDFDNHATNPLGFDWESGTLTLEGAEQRFEVAGQDRAISTAGFDDNFAFGAIEIVSAAGVTFIDTRQNFGGGGAEALYVHALVLRTGASVTIDGVNVYYQVLADDGAMLTMLNGGSLQAIGCEANADCHDFNPCTFDRCAGAFCASETVAYGDLAGAGGSCGPDGSVGLLDILAVLDGFGAVFAEGCASSNVDIAGPGGSCGSDGGVDLVDILAVLNAFSGTTDCCVDGP